jgi:hypothetical protein
MTGHVQRSDMPTPGIHSLSDFIPAPDVQDQVSGAERFP